MDNYLEDAARKYGVFISDLRCDSALRTQVLLELTVEAEKYSLDTANEAVSYLENCQITFSDFEEMKNHIFNFLKIGKDNFVVGFVDDGVLVRDEEGCISMVICEPESHPIGTTIEDVKDTIPFGEGINAI